MVEKLGFGCASLSSMKSSVSVNKLLHTAFNMGITHFDTAPIYGQGFSEKLVGAFIKNKRDKIYVATKFGLGNYPTSKIPSAIALPLNYYRKSIRGMLSKSQIHLNQVNEVMSVNKVASYTPPIKRVSKSEIEISLSNSLKRLNTDYIDYYLLHENLPVNVDEDAWRFLQEKILNGVILTLGIGSNIQMIKTLEDDSIRNWKVLQYEYDHDQINSLLKRHPNKMHIIHSCLKHRESLHVKDIPPENRAGYLLADCARQNISGKVLFSTRNISRLEKNLESFHKYY